MNEVKSIFHKMLLSVNRIPATIKSELDTRVNGHNCFLQISYLFDGFVKLVAASWKNRLQVTHEVTFLREISNVIQFTTVIPLSSKKIV